MLQLLSTQLSVLVNYFYTSIKITFICCTITIFIVTKAPPTRIRIRLYPQTFCYGFKSLCVHTYSQKGYEYARNDYSAGAVTNDELAMSLIPCIGDETMCILFLR